MRINVVDMFCGAGGTSTGLYAAAQQLGLDVDLLAINHWPIAIATHSANHTHARHVCETLDSVNPRTMVPTGHLNFLVASPECTHFSNARGARPRSDQSRASAWHVLRWIEVLKVDSVLLENVKEFRNWGPLDADGQPIKSRKGETFKAFISAFRALNYTVDWRVLNAADYGDPTTRERLFIIAHRGNRRVCWPEPTHGTNSASTRPWRAAREIIDWSLPGKSIFARKKPLAPKTMKRILAGLEKFGGKDLEPFLVVLRNHGEGRSLDAPLPTITAGGNHVGLCKPFVLGQQSGGAPRSVDNPLPTVAGAGAISVIQPFLVPNFGEREGQKPRCHSVEKPLPAVTGHGAGALCEPVLVPYYGKGRASSVKSPIPTVTGNDRFGLAEPFLVKFNNNSKPLSVQAPVPTVMSHDKVGLCTPQVNGMHLDIRFRMLQPHELAAAQGFPANYKFTGTRSERVKQIGNAVPTHLACALCKTILSDV